MGIGVYAGAVSQFCQERPDPGCSRPSALKERFPWLLPLSVNTRTTETSLVLTSTWWQAGLQRVLTASADRRIHASWRQAIIDRTSVCSHSYA